MRNLVKQLRNGETVVIDLACGNKLTIEPRMKWNDKDEHVVGFFISSKDELPFANVGDPDDDEHSEFLDSRYLQFYVSMEALPQLTALLQALKRINKTVKPKPTLYLRHTTNGYWVCILKDMNTDWANLEIYFREGEDTLFNCAPTYFASAGAACDAVDATNKFILDWNGF